MDPVMQSGSVDSFPAAFIVYPWGLAATLGCLAVATAGALAANCLGTYSPTKLENRVEDAGAAQFVFVDQLAIHPFDAVLDPNLEVRNV